MDDNAKADVLKVDVLLEELLKFDDTYNGSDLSQVLVSASADKLQEIKRGYLLCKPAADEVLRVQDLLEKHKDVVSRFLSLGSAIDAAIILRDILRDASENLKGK